MDDLSISAGLNGYRLWFRDRVVAEFNDLATATAMIKNVRAFFMGGGRNKWLRFGYKVLRGDYDDLRESPTFHVMILQHTLRPDLPKKKGLWFQQTDHKVIETFTRYSEYRALKDALHRVEQLVQRNKS